MDELRIDPPWLRGVRRRGNAALARVEPMPPRPHATHARGGTTSGTVRPSVAWLRRAGLALWRSLERIGEQRGAHELLALAARWESTQPELAKQLRLAAIRLRSRNDAC